MRYHKFKKKIFDHAAPSDYLAADYFISKIWRPIIKSEHLPVCTKIKSLYIYRLSLGNLIYWFLDFTFNFSYESSFQNTLLQKAFYYSWSFLSKVYSGTAKWQQDLELVVGYGLQSHRYLTCGASSNGHCTAQ